MTDTVEVPEALDTAARWLSAQSRSWDWDHVSHEGDRQWWRSEASDFLTEIGPLLRVQWEVEVRQQVARQIEAWRDDDADRRADEQEPCDDASHGDCHASAAYSAYTRAARIARGDAS